MGILCVQSPKSKVQSPKSKVIKGRSGKHGSMIVFCMTNLRLIDPIDAIARYNDITPSGLNTMQITARMSKTYMWRLALFAGIFLAYACWSAYDGFVAYPEINRKAVHFEDYKKKHADWRETWPTYAKANGYPEDPDPAKGAFSMYAQYVQLGITLPIGLAALVAYLRGFKRYVAADEKGLVTDGGQRAEFVNITNLNKDRWKTKGIAVVTYQAEGIDRKLVLDDWKYDRDPTMQLLRQVESHLRDDQITGDIRETAKDAAAAETAAQVEQNAG